MFRVLFQKLSGALLLAGGYALVQSENNALNISVPRRLFIPALQ